MSKEYHLWLCEGYPTTTKFTVDGTIKSIENNKDIINTIQIETLSLNLFNMGYDVYLHFTSKSYKKIEASNILANKERISITDKDFIKILMDGKICPIDLSKLPLQDSDEPVIKTIKRDTKKTPMRKKCVKRKMNNEKITHIRNSLKAIANKLVLMILFTSEDDCLDEEAKSL